MTLTEEAERESMSDLRLASDECSWCFLAINDWRTLSRSSRLRILLSVFLTPLTLPFIGRSPRFKLGKKKG